MTINRVYMNAFDTLYTVVYIWAFDTLYSAYKDVWHTIQCSMQLATRKNHEISSIFHELILEEYMKDQADPHGRIAAGGAMPPRQVFVRPGRRNRRHLDGGATGRHSVAQRLFL